MDDPDAPREPRGMALRRRVLVPALLVGAVVAVASTIASPGGSVGEGPPPEMTPEESKRIEDFVHRFQRGQRLLFQGKDADAEQIFRDLLAEQPDAAAVQHAIAFVLKHRGKSAEALEAFVAAARLAPEDGAIRRDCALHLFEAGRAAEALPHLEAARKHMAPDVETILVHGHVLRAAGRDADAEKTYREALVADPESVDARTTVAAFVVARDPAEALRLTETIPPQWPDVVHVRATATELQRKWAAASDLWARLVEVTPPGPTGIAFLRDAAEGLVRCGDAARATTVAARWTETDRTGDKPSFRSSTCLAVARAGTGDVKGAVAALDAAAVPEKVPAQFRAHLGLVRAHCRIVAGELAGAREVLESVRGTEGAKFEAAAAARLLGLSDAAALEAAAKGEAGRSNDIEWIEALVATLGGDAETAAKHRVRAAELSDPPGEHPGLLLCVGRRK